MAFWSCGGLLELCPVVAHWSFGGSLEQWWLIGAVVALWSCGGSL